MVCKLLNRGARKVQTKKFLLFSIRQHKNKLNSKKDSIIIRTHVPKANEAIALYLNCQNIKTNIKKLNTRYVGQGKEFVMALFGMIDFLGWNMSDGKLVLN